MDIHEKITPIDEDKEKRKNALLDTLPPEMKEELLNKMKIDEQYNEFKKMLEDPHSNFLMRYIDEKIDEKLKKIKVYARVSGHIMNISVRLGSKLISTTQSEFNSRDSSGPVVYGDF